MSSSSSARRRASASASKRILDLVEATTEVEGAAAGFVE